MRIILVLLLLFGLCFAKSYTDISQIRAGNYTNPVIIHGITTVPTGRFGADVFYVQDSSSGIRCSDQTKPQIQLGNEVEVLGNVRSSQGELMIDVISVQIFGEQEPPAPIPLSTSQAGQESYEGMLVIVGGMVTKVNAAENLICLDDGSGTIWIYFDPDTGLDTSPFGLSEKWTAVGIVTQIGSSYLLQPRFQSDLKKGGTINKATWGKIKKLYQNHLAALRKKRLSESKY